LLQIAAHYIYCFFEGIIDVESNNTTGKNPMINKYTSQKHLTAAKKQMTNKYK
jgi:hypothetical protein